MSTEVLSFEIPAVPPSKNERNKHGAHWSWRSAKVREWASLVHLFAPKITRLIAEPSVVEITFYTRRARDPGNLHEYILDGLRGRVLVDDDSKVVRWLHLASRSCKEHPTKRPATRVRIWRDPTAPARK